MKNRDVFKTLRWSVSEKKLMDLTVNYFRKMLHFMFDRLKAAETVKEYKLL